MRILTTVILILLCGCGDSPTTPNPIQIGPDPLETEQWYLNNTGQSTYSTGNATIGKDLNMINTLSGPYSGKGIHLLLSDDGLDYLHEDLSLNYDSSRSRDYTQAAPFTGYGQHHSISDGHGTSVAGIMAALANNSIGIRGIAPNVGISSANLISSAVTVTLSRLVDQAATTADIVNQSWGASQSSVTDIASTYQSQLQSAVTNGRNMKGTIFVQSAGNNYQMDLGGSLFRVGNSNFDGTKSTPYTLVVGALDSTDEAASRSSPGANLWISAYGGGNGNNSPAILTTDRSGCFLGLSITGAIQNLFENGTLSINSDCNYSSTMNGTSAAAPMVSGAIALILEANSSLSWRDIKYILADTAVPVNLTGGSTENPNVASPSGHVWEPGWTTNQAGYSFHNRFGFGKIDIDAAITMAENYNGSLGTWIESSAQNSGTLSLAIPDQDASGITHTISVSNTLTIESVTIHGSITHPNIGQIGIELTSPNGTKSVLKYINDSLNGIPDLIDTQFVSNGFYGESANGNWTIKIIDGAAGSNGFLDQWSISFSGH